MWLIRYSLGIYLIRRVDERTSPLSCSYALPILSTAEFLRINRGWFFFSRFVTTIKKYFRDSEDYLILIAKKLFFRNEISVSYRAKIFQRKISNGIESNRSLSFVALEKEKRVEFSSAFESNLLQIRNFDRVVVREGVGAVCAYAGMWVT